MDQEKPQLLILYSTVDGHTKAICEYLQKKLTTERIITISSLEEIGNLRISNFDQVLIGASVRYGYHRKNLYKFINDNKQELDKKKTIFFSVNLTARKSDKNTSDTNPYIIKFLKKVDWEPNIKEVFAGRLDYPSLDCANKLAILFIMLITNGPKDISKTYELTDWERVDQLAESMRQI